MKIVKLQDVATFEISGVDKKTKDGQKIVRLCNYVDVYKNWAITKDMTAQFMVASASDKEIQRFTLRQGQVAITKDSETKDDIGIPSYIADDFDGVILGYHCALITPNKDLLNGKYLTVFLNSPYCKQYFENNASGSGQRYMLNLYDIANIPIILPSIEEQVKIGEFFSNIDRKIYATNQIIDTLSDTTRKLYEHWFLQYDFPNEEGKPYAQSGGAFEYNSVLKQEIPVGWSVGKISDLVDECGKSVSPSRLPSGLHYTPLDRLPARKLSFSTFAPIEEALSSLQLYRKKNIILGSMRVYFHKVCIAPFDGVTRSTAIVMSPKKEDTLGFCYQVINEVAFIKYATQMSNGSQQPMVSWNALSDKTQLIPPYEIMVKYSKVVEDMIETVLTCELEIISLREMRDKLLPMLISGEIHL